MAAGAVEVNITTNNSLAGAQFDGTDDLVTIGNSATFAFGEKDFSISLWFKSGFDFSGDQGIMFGKRDATARTKIYFETDNKIGVEVSDGAQTETIKCQSVQNDNSWHNVIATLQKGLLTGFKMYIDGVLQADTGDLTDIDSLTNAADIILGRRTDAAARYYNGAISNVMIWDKLLSTTEVASVYAGNEPTDKLIGKWALSTDYTDSVGDNDGTNTGSILGIYEDEIAAVIAADRTTANDKYLMVGLSGGQVVTSVIEEAP